MKKHYTSVFDNEQNLLRAVLDLHNSGKPLDLDPMYFKGGFYREIERPLLIYDINPRLDFVAQGNAEDLPLENDSVSSVILDPLFLFGIHGNTKKYYTSSTMGILKDFHELERHYKAILAEAHRVLCNGGLLIFKCQDYTDSRTTMTRVRYYGKCFSTRKYKRTRRRKRASR